MKKRKNQVQENNSYSATNLLQSRIDIDGWRRTSLDVAAVFPWSHQAHWNGPNLHLFASTPFYGFPLQIKDYQVFFLSRKQQHETAVHLYVCNVYLSMSTSWTPLRI